MKKEGKFKNNTNKKFVLEKETKKRTITERTRINKIIFETFKIKVTRPTINAFLLENIFKN